MTDDATANLSTPQRVMVECYERLDNILEEHRDNMAPFEERNALKAKAALWQIVNGLDLDPPHV